MTVALFVLSALCMAASIGLNISGRVLLNRRVAAYGVYSEPEDERPYDGPIDTA